ncbi:hypothetical protein JOD43_001860 [Pullulanibacillus pueri]|nr:hypothetical protein [Pullulanibacillus pueri]
MRDFFVDRRLLFVRVLEVWGSFSMLSRAGKPKSIDKL